MYDEPDMREPSTPTVCERIRRQLPVCVRHQYEHVAHEDVSQSLLGRIRQRFSIDYKHCRIQTHVKILRRPDRVRLEIRPLLTERLQDGPNQDSDADSCQEQACTSPESLSIQMDHHLWSYEICVYERDMWTQVVDDQFLPRLNQQPEQVHKSAFAAFILSEDYRNNTPGGTVLHIKGCVRCERYCKTAGIGRSCHQCQANVNIHCDFQCQWNSDASLQRQALAFSDRSLASEPSYASLYSVGLGSRTSVSSSPWRTNEESAADSAADRYDRISHHPADEIDWPDILLRNVQRTMKLCEAIEKMLNYVQRQRLGYHTARFCKPDEPESGWEMLFRDHMRSLYNEHSEEPMERNVHAVVHFLVSERPSSTCKALVSLLRQVPESHHIPLARWRTLQNVMVPSTRSSEDPSRLIQL
eukprot:scpid67679/ scgid1993/ 